ncbi:MAG: permease [Candidatus Melainabacteria bacterium]
MDWLLWGSVLAVAASLVAAFFWLPGQATHAQHADPLSTFLMTVQEYALTIWPGVLAGIGMVGLLARVPREMVMATLGRGNTVSGIGRAILAGLFLDLCTHGILMVGAKLYERGASLGQLMAFLITSPWNSMSMTFILITLIGWQWVLVFLLVSMLIGFISGLVFNQLEQRGVLPANPHQSDLPENYALWPEVRSALGRQWRQFRWAELPGNIVRTLQTGLSESTMVIKWTMVSILMVGVVRAFVDVPTFQAWVGPSLMGLGVTLVAATVIEVCSEGSLPLAADIFLRAHAPGNSLAFLMAGASTDYTEIMILRETTKSWKIALFLPLVTLPQIVLIAWILNHF